jgi:hypothetical protein
VAVIAGVGSGRGTGTVEAQRSPDLMQQKSQDPFSPSAADPGALPSDRVPDMMDPMTRGRMNEERVKALNDARHRRLEEDAATLQALSTELKSDVDKTDKDELSLDVMRKAGEIEKLAHDVQSRMKN